MIVFTLPRHFHKTRKRIVPQYLLQTFHFDITLGFCAVSTHFCFAALDTKFNLKAYMECTCRSLLKKRWWDPFDYEELEIWLEGCLTAKQQDCPRLFLCLPLLFSAEHTCDVSSSSVIMKVFHEEIEGGFDLCMLLPKKQLSEQLIENILNNSSVIILG